MQTAHMVVDHSFKIKHPVILYWLDQKNCELTNHAFSLLQISAQAQADCNTYIELGSREAGPKKHQATPRSSPDQQSHLSDD